MAAQRWGLEEYDRDAEMAVLSKRLRAASDDLALARPGSSDHRLARERLEVLLTAVDIAVRQWAEIRLPTDPAPDPRLETAVLLLTRWDLENERQVVRARRMLAELDRRHLLQ